MVYNCVYYCMCIYIVSIIVCVYTCYIPVVRVGEHVVLHVVPLPVLRREGMCMCIWVCVYGYVGMGLIGILVWHGYMGMFIWVWV
jgi:hypothetical protein